LNRLSVDLNGNQSAVSGECTSRISYRNNVSRVSSILDSEFNGLNVIDGNTSYARKDSISRASGNLLTTTVTKLWVVAGLEQGADTTYIVLRD